MLNGKAMLVLLTARLTKKDSINEWIFSRTNIVRRKVKVELGWSNHARKTDLKNAAGVDKSTFAKTVDWANQILIHWKMYQLI